MSNLASTPCQGNPQLESAHQQSDGVPAPVPAVSVTWTPLSARAIQPGRRVWLKAWLLTRHTLLHGVVASKSQRTDLSVFGWPLTSLRTQGQCKLSI
jgi:hypothetical protein